MTLACLARQFCTELGPAQPRLVIYFFQNKVPTTNKVFKALKVSNLPTGNIWNRHWSFITLGYKCEIKFTPSSDGVFTINATRILPRVIKDRINYRRHSMQTQDPQDGVRTQMPLTCLDTTLKLPTQLPHSPPSWSTTMPLPSSQPTTSCTLWSSLCFG